MNKRSFLKPSVLLFLLFGLILFTTSILPVEAKREKNVLSFDAPVKSYSNLSKLEKSSPIIVQATFTGERETIHENLTEGRLFRSDSVVEIKKVIKGDLDKKDKIIVYEPAILKDDETYLTIEGYNLMNENGRYTLFLTPAENMEGYAIVGVYQGKYDNSIKTNAKIAKRSVSYEDVEETDFFGQNAEHYNKLKEEVIKKYKW